jgi:aminoglycoside phosphotransferase (APT) family kinase protein
MTDATVTPPIVSGFDAATLLAAVASEGWPVELSGAVLHSDGWENAVVETADGWILRFPRVADLPFEREVAILDRLAGRLPVPIPAIAFTGARTRFAAYRKLAGIAFNREAYLASPATRRDALAASLARFLAAMHAALSDVEIAELGIPTVDHQRTLDAVLGGLDELPDRHRRLVEPLAERFARSWAAGPVAGPQVVLHNDFHTWNMVFAPPGPVSELAAIWDFSCVQIGEPTYDLRYLDKSPRDLLERVAYQYERLTGRELDVPAAVVALRLENALDALETGRLELLDEAVARWARTDAGL